MHKLLVRQLKKAGLGDLSEVTDERWLKLLERIDAAYHQADEERYINERANEISSKEMLSLYQKLQESSASALVQERDRLKSVLKSIGWGLLLLDDAGLIIDTNSACEHLLGYAHNELLGTKITSLIVGDSNLINLSMSQNISGCLFMCKHRQPLDVSFVLNPIKLAGKQQGAVLLFRDITQQLTDEKALVDARSAAEKASVAKSEFLSRMSHELRTPMNSILGFAQLLEINATNHSENEVVAIEQIKLAGEHLLNLINDVLDLAKIEAGKIEVTLEEASVTKVISECLALIAVDADNRAIELVDKVGDYYGMALIDPMRLKQVCLNLLSNALKYNHYGGQVIVTTEIIENDVISISFQDTGPGLTDAQISRLFNQFERLENTENVEGSGIGLVITKHLTELMNGSIMVASVPGEGSTFRLEFKLVCH